MGGIMNRQKQPITYKDAGVDIDAGDALVDAISPHLHSTARIGAQIKIGGFASALDIKELGYQDPIILHTTDGVGTKLKLAQQINKHDTIGIDLVAMNVNDLLVHGAEPVSFLDYFATGKLSIEIAQQVITGIIEGCKQSNCALSGGETAEMPGMYAPGEYDLAGFAIGVVERDNLLPKLDAITSGDIVLGFPSSGIHSNGYSLLRYFIAENNIDLFAKPPFESEYDILHLALLKPTVIYVKSLLPFIKLKQIKALAHITGGGLLENIPRILPAPFGVELDMACWPMLPVFNWLQELGNIPAQEMLRTFNCGIGMIAIVGQDQAHRIKTSMNVFEIGKVVKKNGTPSVIIHNITKQWRARV
jgi:phosphoribosylaminoimidazole synthetase